MLYYYYFKWNTHWKEPSWNIWRCINIGLHNQILTSKLGMQPNTTFISFEWKFSFCRNWTVFLSKYNMSSSKLWFLLKWWVSFVSDGSIFVFEIKCNFADFLFVFHVVFLFPLHIYSLGHWSCCAHHIVIFIFHFPQKFCCFILCIDLYLWFCEHFLEIHPHQHLDLLHFFWFSFAFDSVDVLGIFCDLAFI